jgi:3-hydroxyacyl-CoA dehydrogenase/enoyl-CoA hydratase/3-hydroxybutyryl-CoA epimerase
MATAGALFGKQLKRRWLSKAEAARKMTLLQPTLDYDGFGGADLVVEAVVEKLEIKQAVFADVESRVSKEAVLASNTSSISIDLIAAKAEHPERFVGMHFFNPVHKMPLVEVIRGSKTSDEATATVIAFSRRLGKTPIVVKDGPGFLVNRLLTFSLAEAMWLLDEGHAIEDLDRIMKDWGQPMGPIELTDEVGIDVAVKVGHIIGEAFSERLSFPGWFDKLVEAGRLGAKTRSGFYSYSGAKRQKPDPEAYRLLGIQPTVSSPDPTVLADRTILPMVNEAARCLAEGVVGSAGELDLSMIMGTGFPPFRGGLCRWADDQGGEPLLEAMRRLASSVGERYQPASELEKIVADGGFYAAYP